MMSMGVRMFGCSAYQSSQTEACDCGKRGEEEEEAERRLAALPHDEKVRLIADYYARHNPSKTREDAAAAVDKYGYDKKAFLSLCRSLEEKYQAAGGGPAAAPREPPPARRGDQGGAVEPRRVDRGGAVEPRGAGGRLGFRYEARRWGQNECGAVERGAVDQLR
eukprot:CAMPEP_0113693318 /NCGR_PEP_ID=MMETSP0038_2-20120614/19594_1 /TAXON_ID=2898 /ORGANISM="Cryptomonas paramecium" /LENGTH=163 /DNA_ID=CAMNT_0000615369 /DNA_START=374 /DNA_END=861 /DNA_ORIENTATION=+ /assembly_acc=CAM_ASM_000170